MNKITSFTARYRFLSNFHPAVVKFNHIEFPTVEHGYVAARTLDIKAQEAIAALPSPAAAKKAGKTLVIRDDWDAVKLIYMEDLLRQKFVGPLADALIATAPMELIEGNWWGDTFWGESPVGQGKNHLGKLLMQIREDLITLTKD